ncbi:MAG: N-acetylmuramoyl-L-alanine amidase [Clostridia bacterium]|nr:N-acetylmuramoyl-L-alanine amidase [Clostridia bacterium]
MENKITKIIALISLSAAVAITVLGVYFGDTCDVVIDAGHGGTDFGAIFEDRNEKEDNLALALLVYERLEEMGIDAELTRDTDKKISLEKRCSFANRKRAEFFVSLHRNSAEGAKGVEIWVTDDENSEKDVRLAESILSALDEVGISQNRGVKKGYARGEGNYYVNSHTQMPSCLVELGFINSETDNKLLDEHLNEYASAIAGAIAENLNTAEA